MTAPETAASRLRSRLAKGRYVLWDTALAGGTVQCACAREGGLWGGGAGAGWSQRQTAWRGGASKPQPGSERCDSLEWPPRLACAWVPSLDRQYHQAELIIDGSPGPWAFCGMLGCCRRCCVPFVWLLVRRRSGDPRVGRGRGADERRPARQADLLPGLCVRRPRLPAGDPAGVDAHL